MKLSWLYLPLFGRLWADIFGWGYPCEKSQVVDEVTAFTDEASTLGWILQPMGQGDITGIDPVMGSQRFIAIL